MHKHEWSVDHRILPEKMEGTDIRYGECFAYCECGEELRCPEIERRLNAPEELSAMQAKEIIVFAMGSTRISQPDLAKALRAYAERMEA